MKAEELMYFNNIGGFSKDGKEYIVRVTKEEKTPVPWSHIIANNKIGTLVTSNGGGFTWYVNSRENKITTWQNDVILDTPSEIITLKDKTKEWSVFPNNILDGEEFEVIYGFGYAKYKLISKRYEQELTVFVTEEPAQKVCILKLKNLENKTKNITIKYEIDAVLGVAKEYTSKHLAKEFKENTLRISNKYNNDYSEYFLDMNIITIEGETIIETFNNESKYVGLETQIELELDEEKEIVFVLKYSKEDNNTNTITQSNNQIKGEKYNELANGNLNYYKQAFENEKSMWKNRLEKIQVTTPIDSMNIILNGWIIYQSLTSRIWGRASFYQSGGAFGFRDQLQDMLSMLYFDTSMVKEQIIYHAKHQFPEGDVLHWWHPERNNGIRTRFSDDLLWLVYVTCEYINFTGDFEILNQEIPFIDGRLLAENEDEVYIETIISDESATLLEHCIRAINKSLEFGEHGLPKMGSGDWNDGMNMVGGESIWLGFFLADILKKILLIIKDEKFEDTQNSKENDIVELEKINKIKEIYEKKFFELQKNLDAAWDGRWFKRAYFKTGEALGSNQNDECKIDNISQSWSVISGVAKKEKQIMAMDSVENYLVDHENMFIKLLTPAFCNTKLEPGYIKSYIPGVRENGGQYTHGAIWAIIANCILNRNSLAVEYFRMLNPIEHTRTKEDALKYKSEPYVIVADIYSHPNLIGRGGWSWYTGSASWYFISGIKYILGLNKVGEYLEINPKIPDGWNNCYIKYNIENTEYIISIERILNCKDNKEESIENKFEKIIYFDNEIIESNYVKIDLDGKQHKIDVKIK